jgi:hypothetical protein
LRDGVGLHACDARTVSQHPLNHGLLGGVVEVADVEHCGRGAAVVLM